MRDNDMRVPALLLLQLLPFVEATSSNVSFVPGAICSDVDPASPARSLLQGKHLRMYELEWPPFASRDATAPHGWVGYDIDMIVAVAEFLGFTFEIHEAQQLTGETYTETLIRTANDVDLWLSWWLRDKYRMNFTIMLAGHVDASPTLVRPPLKEAKASESFVKSLTTFYLPFSYPLWGCLIAMIFASGLVDNLLEKHNGGRLTASFFEYFAGVLWGGFHDPITRISALYQLANAFIILIIVSAYTANLASILTLARQPVATFDSLEGLISMRLAACTVGTYGQQSTYEEMYSSLRYQSDFTRHQDIAAALISGTCDASIAPRIDFDTWLVDGTNCKLATVGPSLFFSAAGWVTNLQSEPCVQRAIEYALHHLQAEGTMGEIFDEWMPEGACTSSSSSSSGRRLSTASEPYANRRRLSAGAGGRGGASSEGGGEPVEGQLILMDFLGLFALWGVMTIVCLIAHVMMAWYDRRSKRNKTGSSEEEKGDDIATIAPDLNINDTSAMLRHLIVAVARMKGEEEVMDVVKRIDKKLSGGQVVEGGRPGATLQRRVSFDKTTTPAQAAPKERELKRHNDQRLGTFKKIPSAGQEQEQHEAAAVEVSPKKKASFPLMRQASGALPRNVDDDSGQNKSDSTRRGVEVQGGEHTFGGIPSSSQQAIYERLSHTTIRRTAPKGSIDDALSELEAVTTEWSQHLSSSRPQTPPADVMVRMPQQPPVQRAASDPALLSAAAVKAAEEAARAAKEASMAGVLWGREPELAELDVGEQSLRSDLSSPTESFRSASSGRRRRTKKRVEKGEEAVVAVDMRV